MLQKIVVSNKINKYYWSVKLKVEVKPNKEQVGLFKPS